MEAFVPAPALKTFFDTMVFYAKQGLVQGSGWGGYTYSYLALTVPVPPARPTDPIHAAFYDNLCMPLYHLLTQAAGIGTNLITGPPTTDPQVIALAAALNISTDYAGMIIAQEQQAFTSGP